MWLFALPMALALLALVSGCQGSTPAPPMSGYVEVELIYVAPPTAGVLQTLTVKRGDMVKRGQSLYALESDAEVYGRDAASARREVADAQLRNLQKGRRPAELQAIDQQLAQAAAAVAASTSALQRNQKLVEQGFQSPARLDELVAARDRDGARIRELQAQRQVAAAAARADEIAAAAASVQGSAADLALARWREGQKQRSAPVDAQVYDVMYRPGEWVNAGAPVVALLPPAAIKLRFFVPENELPKAVLGQAVTVACDGCKAGLSARIRFIAPQAEFTPPVIYSNGSRSKLVFLVEAEPLDPAAFKPGQPVDVWFAKVAPS